MTMTTGDGPLGYQFYQMPDGRFMRSEDPAAIAAHAWALEAVKELRQVNERLARIEKALALSDNRGDPNYRASQTLFFSSDE
jgi:hypothetical protein